jgi:hypothetical protein
MQRATTNVNEQQRTSTPLWDATNNSAAVTC